LKELSTLARILTIGDELTVCDELVDADELTRLCNLSSSNFSSISQTHGMPINKKYKMLGVILHKQRFLPVN